MAKFIIPRNPGTCTIIGGLTGLSTVTNGKGRKDAIYIPCRNRAEAEHIRDKINSGDHPGEINIPKHVYRTR